MKIVIDIPEEDYMLMKLSYESGMGNSAMKRILQGTPIEQTNTEESVLKDIKAEIPKMTNYESADGQDLVMVADMIELINKHISGKE